MTNYVGPSLRLAPFTKMMTSWMVFGLIMDPGDDRPAGFAVTSWVQFECRFLYSNGSSTAWHTDYRGVLVTFYYFLLILFSSLSFPYLSLFSSGHWYFCGLNWTLRPHGINIGSYWINDHQVWRTSWASRMSTWRPITILEILKILEIRKMPEEAKIC